MNLEKAIEILEHHNRWRRDESVLNSLEMVNPTELGKAIDLVTVELRMLIVSDCISITKANETANLVMKRKNVLFDEKEQRNKDL
jgi:hypothetical protein